VYLHRSHADVELVGDEFVGQAAHHQPHHIALPVRQAFEQCLQSGGLLALRQCRAGSAQGLLNPVDQRVVGKRFLAKIEGAAFDRIDCRGHVGVAGQKNHRQRGQQAVSDEFFKHGQAA